jgi:hypothetical protein
VEDPSENLRKHLSLKVKARQDQAPDVAALIDLLEQEVGFAPITEVQLELRGRLVRRDGALFLEVSDIGPTFRVEKSTGDARPPENRLIVVTAGLVDIRSVDRIVLAEWKDAEETKP